MLNGNSEHDFLMCYRDRQGNAKFSKARKAKASKRIDWAWDVICGSGSGGKTGIGFFPTNSDHESCWGAMDFDVHNEGQRELARTRAAKAFALLSANPRLWLILGTSGSRGGWHLFIFTEYFFSTEDWARLLREVAEKLGAPIQRGVLEIFPDGRARGLGFGIRAPGSWNPKDDTCGLITLDPAMPKLRELPALQCSGGKEKTSLSVSSTTRGSNDGLTSSKVFRGDQGDWPNLFAITAPRTRHDRLSKLVGRAFRETTENIARENARLQYVEAEPQPASSIDEHLAEFDQLWAGMDRDWRASLTHNEREKFEGLTNKYDCEAFRIVQNWSRKPDPDTGQPLPDFYIVCETLAARLGVSIQTASIIRRRFCSLGILRKVAEYTPHKWAARYEWLSTEGRKKQQGTHR
jgi:hypothetical protein